MAMRERSDPGSVKSACRPVDHSGMTPNAVARTILGLAGILYACGGIFEVAEIPMLLGSKVEPQFAPYIQTEARMAVFLGALSIAIGIWLFRARARIAARIEPATEGDAALSAPVQALAYRLLGFYYLIPAVAAIVMYAIVEIHGGGAGWFVWSTPLAQTALAVPLILRADRLARAWPT
jgi:hypothetical protein